MALSKKTKKTLLGGAAAVGLGTAAYFLFLRDADAAGPSGPSEGPAGPELPPGDDKPVDPQDPPKPKPPATPTIKRASGSPPPGCEDGWYDTSYWDAGTPEQNRQRVINDFHQLGYAFQGATKSDGTFKTAGTIKRFQEDYNLVSRSGEFGGGMGGLAMDGKVGPCTLTALRHIYTSFQDPYEFTAVAREQRQKLGL